MSALARIRKTALQHEQERQYDKALALYARILDGAEAGEEEVDVALFNRAGDLALRVGDTPRALGYFERALDLYASGGLLNNAVALGVKILRHAPAHLSAHYTLGVLYGRKGFASEARHHLLTYAVQMQRAGRADEATRVLGEVAAACLDTGERRAALDAYGALGGDPAHAVALAAEPAPARPDPLAPAPVADAPVMWGAVDFEPVAPAAVPTPASAPAPVEQLLEWDGVSFDTPASEPATAAWDVLELEPAMSHEPEATIEAPLMEASSLVFLDVGLDVGVDAGTVELLDFPIVEPAAPAAVPAATSAAVPGPRWPTALPDEPPPLRLAELLRLDLEPETSFGPQTSVHVDGLAHDGAPDFPLEPPAALQSERWFIGDETEVAERAEDDDDPIEVVPSYGFRFDAPDLDVPDPSLADALDVALELPMIGSVPPTPAEPATLADLAAPVGTPASDVWAVADESPAAATFEPTTADDLLDLGAWLRETEEEPSTRMTTARVPQTGDEQADFDATLRVFTAGVARAVEHHDFDGHYDLGVAFREMGLMDEAIVEFQRAALAPGRPLRALEALAQCFLDVRQPEVALSTLEEAVAEAAASGAGDASLVGVHYLMAVAAQALGRSDDARRWFVRVVATEVRFRDAAARLAALPPPSPVR